MTGLNGSPTPEGVDDAHEHLAEAALQPLFGAAVARPVALHVQAKRVLVSRHPGYAARLSADSRRSLALQGGPMDPADCDRFDQDPHAASALRLRLWDDAAKRTDRGPPSVATALATLDGLMQRVQPTG
jgi:predicted HD phosphohydrolase